MSRDQLMMRGTMSEQSIIRKYQVEMRHALADFITADKRIKSIYNALLRRRDGNVQYARIDLVKNGEFINVLRDDRTDAILRVGMYAQMIQAELAIVRRGYIDVGLQHEGTLDVTGV